MKDTHEKPGRLLLHACCGPCSLEPVRVLRERGVEPVIHYANSNIAPADEYEHRLSTISEWASEQGLELVEGEYRPEKWDEAAGTPWREGYISREERCRACYRQRFEESAEYAAENGFDAMGTTLSVSPYQYTDIIHEELERACEAVGIAAAFEDWRPYYDEATRRSREAGMYRQNYCGCAISKAEAQAERDERKAARKAERDAERERYMQEHADEIAAAEQEREAKRKSRAEYDAKRAKQRQILKALREESSK